MLLAVEGGGLFSSSVSGYSKGLSLLFLSSNSEEERPMKVSPWDHYQVVGQGDSEPDFQLASRRNRLSRGCTAALVCLGCKPTGLEAQSALKVGPSQLQEEDTLPAPTNACEKNSKDDQNVKGVPLRSSLKKASHKKNHTEEARRVQWTDASGRDLVQILEFESSDVDGSDEDSDERNERGCSCSVM